MRTSYAASVGLLGALALSASVARAEPPPEPASEASPAAQPAPPPVAPPAATPVVPTTAAPPAATPAVPSAAPSPARATGSLEHGQHFTLDPVADGVLTASGFGFAFLLTEILGTGEITPPLPTVPPSNLLAIDRGALSQTIDPHATTYSDIGLYTAIGFAVLDPILSGFRDGTDALLVDAFMYAESASLAQTLTDVTKIAVRRPRPIDYINCAPTVSNGTTIPSTNSACNSTDLGLSFFSGHASTVAAIGATATYLAFVRSPHSPRPWITLGAATALTAFVSYERVRAGQHFPTDVIAGSMAGAAIGVLVPHLHRHKEEAPPVWIGVSPVPGGGSLSLQGGF
jgi:membrane-associated phospholipid phosphatase